MNKLANEGKGYLIFSIFNGLVMLLVILVTLFPYLNVFAKALNEGTDSLRGGITIFPRRFTLENFKILLSNSALYTAAFVTVARVAIAIFTHLLVQFMTGYVLSRRGVPGLKSVNMFFLIPMFISAGQIPMYLLYAKMGLLNNFWVYVLPGIFSFYNVMLIRSFITMSISDSLIESFQIDGAGHWKIFVSLILPLSKPILATIGLWTAVGAWNDWSTTLYYVQKPSLYTLQYILMQVIKESERINAMVQNAQMQGENVEVLANSIKTTPDALIAAQVVVVTLPIILVYPFLQKYFLKGIMLGAVKE